MATITKRVKLPTVKLTHSQLVALIDSIRQQLSTHTQSGSSSRVEQLTLISNETTVSFHLPVTPDVLCDSLATSHSACYYFRQTESELSEVVLILEDWQRSIKVRGSNTQQVDAIIAITTQHIMGCRALATGPSFRLGVLAAAFALSQIALQVAINIHSLAIVPRVTIAAIAFAISIFVFVVPSNRIFPGVLVYAPGTSFKERHAASISWWGLVLSLIALIIPVVAWAIQALISSSLDSDSKSQ